VAELFLFATLSYAQAWILIVGSITSTHLLFIMSFIDDYDAV